MSNSSTNVRAALDEARLNELLRKAQDAFLELKAEKEALAKEDRRLALLDAVLAERKVLLDQREAAFKKQEDAVSERELRVQRKEAELTSHAGFLNKLKATREAESSGANDAEDSSSDVDMTKPSSPSQSSLAGIFAKPKAGPPRPTLTKLPPLPPLNLPRLS